jgi:DNA-binding NarL/FixJ family response regulator
MTELKLVLADDHPLIRRGLRELLAQQSGWKVIGEASNGLEAVEMVARLQPDIIVLDFFMPKMTGSQAASQIARRFPRTRCVILTMDDSEQVVREVLQAGVRGLVLKNDADHELLEAVSAVADGRHFFAGSVAKVILSGYLARSSDTYDRTTKPASALTVREQEVVRLLAQGLTSREAAVQLQISPRTVETHRININRKLNLGSVADLVRYALNTGLSSAVEWTSSTANGAPFRSDHRMIV